MCIKLQIDKRRTSGYHAQGNGFAERSIRNVREVLRTALLDKGLAPEYWRDILSSTIFALNTSKSKAINCAPFEVVFGRKPVFPVDITFESVGEGISACSASGYLKDLKIQLLSNIQHAAKFLGISKDQMIKQYNKNLNFNNYKVNDKVWLRNKTFKTGENAKLSPRKSGPWTVIKVYPNQVNFKIEDQSGGQKVVHHNRLSPVVGEIDESYNEQSSDESDCEHGRSNDEGGDTSDLDTNTSDSDAEANADVNAPERRYPIRERRPRIIPGAVPWSNVCL